jgi:hypothetical protein
MFIEADWLNVLVDKGENKVMSFKLMKYDFAAAYLQTSALLSLLMGKQTRITAVDENGCTLRLAWEPTVCLLSRTRKKYNVDTYQWL